MSYLYELVHNITRDEEAVAAFYNTNMFSDLIIVEGYNKEVAKNHRATRARRVKPSWSRK